eukprot:Rmarinus@m.17082
MQHGLTGKEERRRISFTAPAGPPFLLISARSCMGLSQSGHNAIPVPRLFHQILLTQRLQRSQKCLLSMEGCIRVLKTLKSTPRAMKKLWPNLGMFATGLMMKIISLCWQCSEMPETMHSNSIKSLYGHMLHICYWVQILPQALSQPSASYVCW